MSNGAIANPDHIRRFVSELKRRNSELRNIRQSLSAGMASLSSTWKDKQHKKFAEEYIKTLRELDKMIRLSEAHIPLLLKKAQILEDYLKSR